MRYHYVLTLELPGLGTVTANDVVEVNAHHTRSGIYKHVLDLTLRNMIRAAIDAGQRPDPHLTPITRLWSLERETLDA